MTASATINGVDTAQITTLVGHLTEVPSAGDTTWRAEVTWVDGFRNEVRVRDLSPTYVDEPETLGGRNSAPNPVEQLLGALGSCLATGYTANASLRGITIRDLRIELEGHIDLGCFLGIKAGYAGYPEVSVKVNLDAKCREYRARPGQTPDMDPNDGWLVVRNSEVMCGRMDKTTVGSGKKDSIFYVILRDFGPDEAVKAMKLSPREYASSAALKEWVRKN